MHADPFVIRPARASDYAQIVAVWERSVRATHDFLHPDDILFYKRIVEGIDFPAFPVYCLVREDTVSGFVGVFGSKIEMLFLDPAVIGRGQGARLLRFALEALKAEAVDVNEQNTRALAFYRRFGFEVAGRTEVDGAGKPYPVLQLRRPIP